MKMKTYLLVDTSSSMDRDWPKTKSAIDEFVASANGQISISIFSGQHDRSKNFIRVFDGKKKAYKAKNPFDDFRPRGMTPLYDAIHTLANIIHADDPKKAQIVIVTDGEENSSDREMNADIVANIIKGWEKKDYDVVYIGASYGDVTSVGRSFGINPGKIVNMSTSNTYVGTMSAVAKRGTSYASGQTMSNDALEDEIRKAADDDG